MHRTWMPLLLLLLLPLGCAGIDRPAVAPPPERAPHALRWVVESAEYRALVVQGFRVAGERLAELAAGRAAGSWAVSVDADETLISNAGYSLMLFERNRENSDELWREWVVRMEAAALPGARDFLQGVRELGGRVAVVTNRKERDCPETSENFRLAGLPYDLMLCRRGESREKEDRWEAIRRGEADPDHGPLEIVMWVGDNIGDFPDLDQSLRDAEDGALEDFGGRFVVLPNPMYGSWE